MKNIFTSKSLTVNIHKDLSYQDEIIINVPSSVHSFDLIISNGEPDATISIEFDSKSNEVSGHILTVDNTFKEYKFDENGKISVLFDELWCNNETHVGSWMKLRFKYYTKIYYITFKYQSIN